VKLILLEDDPVISLCMQDSLAAAGFEVLPAMSGVEALSMLAQSPDVFGMVVDVRLNEPPDGWEVAHQARRSHPHLAIIYTTTASQATYSENSVDRSILLEKPYTLDRAVSVAHAAIAQARQGPQPLSASRPDMSALDRPASTDEHNPRP
jgi:two-component system, cell cycle response regulator CpdR